MSFVPRVLIWTENYWVGGCDRFVVDLAQGLPARAVQLSLAGNHHPGFDTWLADRVPDLLPRATVPIANLVDSRLVRLRRRTVHRWQASVVQAEFDEDGDPDLAFPVAAAAAALRYQQAVRNYVRLRRLFRRAKPDVLHVNNGGYPGGESCRMAVLAARAEGVPRIVHFVHNMAYWPAFPARAERSLDARVDAATDVWLTAAQRASRQLVDRRELRAPVKTLHYGLPRVPERRGALPPSLRAELGFEQGSLNLAVIANLEPRKGHRILIESLAAVDRKGIPFKAACVGDGSERSSLELLVRERGLYEHVRFLGWREDVDAVLDSADALVLPSLSNECLPYAILEAMEHGLPVISTDVAGIPEMVVHGHTGLVVAPGDVDGLVRAIQQLSANPEGARGMGAAGRARVRTEFTVDRMARQMLDIWIG